MNYDINSPGELRELPVSTLIYVTRKGWKSEALFLLDHDWRWLCHWRGRQRRNGIYGRAGVPLPVEAARPAG